MKSMSTESSQRLLAMDLLGDDEVDEVYDLSLIHISEPTRPY